MQYENYLIDRKLKPGRDYPPELRELIKVFNEKGNDPILRREMELIERLFNRYVLAQSSIQTRYAHFQPSPDNGGMKIVGEAPEVKRDEFRPWGRKVQTIINKVNAKLSLLRPQLLKTPNKPSFFYYLEPTALKFSMRYSGFGTLPLKIIKRLYY